MTSQPTYTPRRDWLVDRSVNLSSTLGDLIMRGANEPLYCLKNRQAKLFAPPAYYWVCRPQGLFSARFPRNLSLEYAHFSIDFLKNLEFHLPICAPKTLENSGKRPSAKYFKPSKTSFRRPRMAMNPERLHDFNKRLLHDLNPSSDPRLSSTSCPKCGLILLDSMPRFIIPTRPLKRTPVHCGSCKYKGYRVL